MKLVAQGDSKEVLVICEKCGNVTFPKKLCDVQAYLERACKKCEHGKAVQAGHKRNRGSQRLTGTAERLAKQMGISLPN